MTKPLTVWIATNWEFLKEMRVPDPLNCLLTNLYSIKKHLELDMEQQTGSKLGKMYIKAIYCHRVYLTYIQSTPYEIPGWTNHKLESRLLGEISTTSDMQVTTLMAKSKEELNSLPMNVKEESEKAGLKLSIQEIKIMASGPITSWEIDGETVETVADFLLWGSKIIAPFHGDCSHEIKRHLLLGRKVMTTLESILKSRDIICQQKSV